MEANRQEHSNPLPYKLDESTIELAVKIAVARIEAERQFKEFVSDPINAQALAEYVKMQYRIFKRSILERSKDSQTAAEAGKEDANLNL